MMENLSDIYQISKIDSYIEIWVWGVFCILLGKVSNNI